MKNIKYIIIGILLAISGIALAGQISVPSAPTTGYALVSTSTGAWIATSTDPFHVGSIYATSTASNYFGGVINVKGTQGQATSTFTTGISVGTGFSPYPEYSFNADTNTGFDSSAPDVTNLVNAGINTVTLTSSNKVGIGTTTPLSLLTVNGNASIGADYNIAAPTNGLIIEGTTGISTSSPSGLLSIGNGVTSGGIYVSTNGNLGIGSSTPNELLSVVGNGNLTGGLYVGQSASLTQVSAPIAGGIVLQRSINPFIQLVSGSTAAGQLRSGSTNRIGLFDGTGSNEYLSLVTSGTSAGLVGISSTTPWGKFSVNPDSIGSGVPEFVIGSSSATHFLMTGNGNTAIGGTSANMHFSIGNNLAVGFMDGYGEYQLGLFDGGSPSSSYGLGVKSGVMIFNSGAGGYEWDSGSTINRMSMSTGGLLGLASSTPWGLLSVNPSGLGSGVPEFVVGSSTATRFVITGNGNIGIGMTNPGATLYVVGESGAQATFAKAGSSVFASNSHPAIISSAITGNLFEGYGGASGNTQNITVKNDGSTGIGTTSPYKKLAVAGDIVADTFIATSTTATSTFANGANATGGCFSQNGVCLANAINSVQAAGTFTNQPLATTTWLGNQTRVQKINFSGITSCKIAGWVTTIGTAGSVMAPAYSVDNGVTYKWIDGSSITTAPAVATISTASTGGVTSASVNIATDMKDEVWFAYYGYGGDGVADPIVAPSLICR